MDIKCALGASCCNPAAVSYAVEDIDDKNIFLSLQLTQSSALCREEWIGGSNSIVKASMPPFNNPQKIELPSMMKAFDIPVFGPIIPNAAMAIFSQPEILALAEQLNLAIPQNKLNAFVQNKMIKVHEMIKAARDEPTLAESQRAAIDKMEVFAKAFEALTSEDIPDLAAWEAFLLKHVESGWEKRLHFDHILDNFGFDREAAQKLRKMHYVWPDGEKVAYEQHALRWLSKAFAAYGPPGTVTDIVNLTFAMMSSPTPASEIQEDLVVETIHAFAQKVSSKSFEGLWIPSHFAMDAETDDCMCWLLLEYIHRARGTQLEKLVQLPTDPILDDLASELAKATGCKILRDPDSQNINAIRKYWLQK